MNRQDNHIKKSDTLVLVVALLIIVIIAIIATVFSSN